MIPIYVVTLIVRQDGMGAEVVSNMPDPAMLVSQLRQAADHVQSAIDRQAPRVDATDAELASVSFLKPKGN